MNKKNRWITDSPIAHRGLHDGNVRVPENSILALEKAIKSGFPIELDVRIIGDSTVVVFHDADLLRVCGVDRRISSLRKTELQGFRLFDTLLIIPTLAEVLTFVDGRVPLLIELKTFSLKKQLEREVLRLVDNYDGPVALQSFNPFTVKWIKKHRPSLCVGQLAEPSVRSFPLNHLENYIQLNTSMNPDFVAFDIHALPSKRVAHFKHKGTPILAWTVRSQAQHERMQGYYDNLIFESFIPQNFL